MYFLNVNNWGSCVFLGVNFDITGSISTRGATMISDDGDLSTMLSIFVLDLKYDFSV